jgi:hypothetical protein
LAGSARLSSISAHRLLIDEHFAITVELVPGARTGLPHDGLPDQQHLTWWAVDNLGHYYLGEQGS